MTCESLPLKRGWQLSAITDFVSDIEAKGDKPTAFLCSERTARSMMRKMGGGETAMPKPPVFFNCGYLVPVVTCESLPDDTIFALCQVQ